jgi:hypothetical protein
MRSIKAIYNSFWNKDDLFQNEAEMFRNIVCTGISRNSSRNFWIYWVISVPLTIVVLLTWRIWWHREKNHYRQKYPHFKLDNIFPDMGSNVFNRLTKMMWERKKLEDIEELN